MTLYFVDVEATGMSPWSGIMTEFGAVNYDTLDTFHGILAESEPSPENPAIPVVTGEVYDPYPVMESFNHWVKDATDGRSIFVSDNPAFDFMWVTYYFDSTIGVTPFGHSARRIGDFFAGMRRDWYTTQAWKKWRVTKHDHHPVHDAMGNVEAFKRIMEELKLLNEK